MQIRLYDADGAYITTVAVDADDHWDACLLGHEVLRSGDYPQADDFQVIEPEREQLGELAA